MVLQSIRRTPQTECWHFSRGTVLNGNAGIASRLIKVLVAQAGGLEFHPLSLRLKTKLSKTNKPKADMVACTCNPGAGEVEASRPPQLTTSLATWPACTSKGRSSPGGHGGQGSGPLGNRNWVMSSSLQMGSQGCAVRGWGELDSQGSSKACLCLRTPLPSTFWEAVWPLECFSRDPISLESSISRKGGLRQT